MDKKVIRLFKNEQAFPGFGMLAISGDGVTVNGQRPVFTILDDNDNPAGYHFYDEKHLLDNYSDGYIALDNKLYESLIDFFLSSGINLPELDDSDYFVTGRIISAEKHSASGHLHVCQVDIGTETVQIVCGSKEIPVGKKVVVALPKAVLPDGKLIQRSKVNGVESMGMLCSASELGLAGAKVQPGLYLVDDKLACGEVFKLSRGGI